MTGIKFVGRDESGRARAVKVNNEGHLEVRTKNNRIVAQKKGFIVNPGQSIPVSPEIHNVDMSDFSHFYVGILTPNEHDYDIMYQTGIYGSSMMDPSYLLENSRDKRTSTKTISLKGSFLVNLYVNNQSDFEQTYDVYLFGVNATDAEALAVPESNMIHYPRFGDLADGAESVLVDTNETFKLNFLEWSTNNDFDVRLKIIPKDVNRPTGIATIANTNGSENRHSTRPRYILEDYSSMWSILEYHDQHELYKFKFNLENMIFPNGVKISLENTGSTTRQAAATIIGSELM